MAAALKFKGYDYKFEFGDGAAQRQTRRVDLTRGVPLAVAQNSARELKALSYSPVSAGGANPRRTVCSVIVRGNHELQQIVAAAGLAADARHLEAAERLPIDQAPVIGRLR